MIGVSWVMALKIRSSLECRLIENMPKDLKQIWRTTPICIFWTIWLERNKAYFEEKGCTFLKLRILVSLIYILDMIVIC